MSREDIVKAIERLERTERPRTSDLDELQELRKTSESEGLGEQFDDRFVELRDHLEDKIRAARISEELGGEPLSREQLIRLVDLCRALYVTRKESKESFKDMVGGWLLFKRNVNHPETLELVLEDDITAEEVVEAATQPKPDTIIYL